MACPESRPGGVKALAQVGAQGGQGGYAGDDAGLVGEWWVKWKDLGRRYSAPKAWHTLPRLHFNFCQRQCHLKINRFLTLGVIQRQIAGAFCAGPG